MVICSDSALVRWICIGGWVVLAKLAVSMAKPAVSSPRVASAHRGVREGGDALGGVDGFTARDWAVEATAT